MKGVEIIARALNKTVFVLNSSHETWDFYSLLYWGFGENSVVSPYTYFDDGMSDSVEKYQIKRGRT